MIGVFIADDHPVVREGIKRMFEETDDIQVVGEAASSEEMLSGLTDEVGVLLLDVTMPGPSFLETIARVREQQPTVRVLVLSVHPESLYAVRAVRAGAAGYLTKDRPPNILLSAVRRVHSGERFVSEMVAEQLVAEPRGRSTSDHGALSKREFQVLVQIGGGRSLKEIANELSLSPKTVSTYRARVLQKLGLRGNADLVRYALEHELLT